MARENLVRLGIAWIFVSIRLLARVRFVMRLRGLHGLRQVVLVSAMLARLAPTWRLVSLRMLLWRPKEFRPDVVFGGLFGTDTVFIVVVVVIDPAIAEVVEVVLSTGSGGLQALLRVLDDLPLLASRRGCLQSRPFVFVAMRLLTCLIGERGGVLALALAITALACGVASRALMIARVGGPACAAVVQEELA